MYSINEGVFPDSLKIACITPIPKCRNPQSPSDYRPISVLPTLSKVFEKLICIKESIPFYHKTMQLPNGIVVFALITLLT